MRDRARSREWRMTDRVRKKGDTTVRKSRLEGPTVTVWKRRVSAAEKHRNTRGFEGIYVKGKENRGKDLTSCCNSINHLAYSQWNFPEEPEGAWARKHHVVVTWGVYGPGVIGSRHSKSAASRAASLAVEMSFSNWVKCSSYWWWVSKKEKINIQNFFFCSLKYY